MTNTKSSHADATQAVVDTLPQVHAERPPIDVPATNKRDSHASGATPPTKAEHRPAPAAHNANVEEAYDHAKGHHRMYTEEEFQVEPYGAAGRLVQKLGLFAYVLFFVFPLAYVAIFFAIIPLGQPQAEGIREQWVFLFVSNTCIMLAIAYLYNAAFLSLAKCQRPFRTSLIPLVSVVIVQLIVMTPIYLTHGVFDWIGIVALAVCYITLFFSMLLAYPDLRPKVHSFFRRFMSLLILYIPLLAGYVIAFRETDSGAAQSGLSFGFAFITFIYRRIMLSRLDPFPLEESQLFAGFWVQNLGDCTTILAFPQVNSPSVLAAVFISNSLSNVAFLIFVSDLWIYKIRPVLKTYVKEAIKCNFPLPDIPQPDESFDRHNRGHDYNVGGYRRRQFRFFFFRLLSQAVAMFMYLGISPMLRFGVNEEFTPLGMFEADEYRNSMIYAAANLGFILLVAFFGYTYLNKQHHQTFHEIREIHRHDFVHPAMVGMVTAIITHNMILTIAIVLSHYCVYASFQGCELSSVVPA